MNTVSLSVQHLHQVFFHMALASLLAFIFAPILTDFLYKNRIGKRLREHGIDGKATPLFTKLHASKAGVPVMGGLLFWVTTAVLTVLFNLDRAETWLPLAVLVASGILGAIDDVLNVLGKGTNGGGLRFVYKLTFFALLAVGGAWWFYDKLGFNTIINPITISFAGHVLVHPTQIVLGWWYIPIFILVTIFFAFSMNQTDGLDGLAGGISAIACFFFVLIALTQGKIHLAIFCATLAGSLIAFLWFNINPARFMMGDTGSMVLGMTLPILAFLTKSVVVLPLILFIPFIEGLSTLIQIFSKKVFKRKVFLVAPIHHHFEALGWSEPKVVMRFWLIAAVGTSLAILLMLAS